MMIWDWIECLLNQNQKKVKFDYNSSYKDKIKKCILQITNNGTVRLSSNSKENIDKINTLEKILERKHVTLKASDTEEGAYVKYELNNLTKKTWKKLLVTTKKSLKCINKYATENDFSKTSKKLLTTP